MTKEGKIAVMNIKIQTEEELGLVHANSIKDMMQHWYQPGLISIDIQEELIDDTREKPEVPYICSQCKWCHNKQCWFEDQYNEDFDGDYDTCFEPEHESIDKQAILDKYWEDVRKKMEESKNVEGME